VLRAVLSVLSGVRGFVCQASGFSELPNNEQQQHGVALFKVEAHEGIAITHDGRAIAANLFLGVRRFSSFHSLFLCVQSACAPPLKDATEQQHQRTDERRAVHDRAVQVHSVPSSQPTTEISVVLHIRAHRHVVKQQAQIEVRSMSFRLCSLSLNCKRQRHSVHA
jgi:hypothetical protein